MKKNIEKKKWNKPQVRELKGYMTETGGPLTVPTETNAYNYSP